MANKNAPRGFLPMRHNSGGEIRTNEYAIAADYNVKIHKGDPVILTGTGKNIAIAGAGVEETLGVFAGCSYIDSTGRHQFSPYWPGVITNTNIVAYVYDDPNIVFEVQVDTCAEGDIGNQMDLAEGAGSDATGQSGAYLDESTKGTTGASFLVLGLVNREGNAYGAYAKVEAIWAENTIKGVVSGVGGV